MANGVYDLTFTLFGGSGGGSAIARPVTNSAIGMTNGLFTALVDFGANFSGADRWLEIAVCTNGTGNFNTLNPRQKLTPTPYAITAANLAGTVSPAGLAGTYSSAVAFSNAGNSFSGNGAGLTALNASQLIAGTVPSAALGNAWRITGNSGTTPGAQYIGTSDSQPLEFKANGARALRLEPDTSGSGAPNLIGGAPFNFVAPGVVGAVIAGGGATDYAGGACTNSVGANFGAIGGGMVNRVQLDADRSTIGGGAFNTIQTGSYDSTIGGGYFNQVQSSTAEATIGGGTVNSIQTGASDSTIGGGAGNRIQNSANTSTISGGGHNTIQTNAVDSTIGGGYDNIIQSDATYATIGGGLYNLIRLKAFDATIGGGYNNLVAGPQGTIPGGDSNVAGTNSFAAGHRAKATHTGAFVWADSTDTDFITTGTNQFLLRATGGVGIGKNNPAYALDVNGTIAGTNDTGWGILGNTATGTGVLAQASSPGGWAGLFRYGSDGNNAAYLGGNGAAATFYGNVTVNGTFNTASDRAAKDHFATIGPADILAKVAHLPVTEWNYKNDASTRHIGPMAQDFYAAFNVGTDNRHIAPMDESGVALAAIQGLNLKLEEKESEIMNLEKRLQKLEQVLKQKSGDVK